jgi:DNA-binding CsgD family transcriptional regulator
VTRADHLAGARRELERIAHAGLDAETLFRRAADVIGAVIPFDGGCWHTLDPATLLITSHWTNLSGDGFPMVLENEYRQPDTGKFAVLAGQPLPAAVLTEANAEASLRYLAYRARGWGSELRASFDLDGDTWGCVMLLRGRDLPEFEDEDARVIASLAPSLAYGLRTAVVLAAAASDAPPADGPGLVLLDPQSRLESATMAAAAWLGDLDRVALPPVLMSVAEKARGATGAARARLRSVTGEWLIVQGTLLGDRVAVVVEPARPVEIAPLVTAAYGLTRREREVTREVLHGRSTTEIALRLSVTPYTVQDHLKSIFAKTGASSRSDLVAKLFFEHFEPLLHPSNLG